MLPGGFTVYLYDLFYLGSEALPSGAVSKVY